MRGPDGHPKHIPLRLLGVAVLAWTTLSGCNRPTQREYFTPTARPAMVRMDPPRVSLTAVPATAVAVEPSATPTPTETKEATAIVPASKPTVKATATLTATIPVKPTTRPTVEARPTVAPIQVKKEEEQGGWVYSKQAIWQDQNWFPLDKSVAARRGIVTLDSSLALYDKLSRYFLGINSTLEKDFRTFAEGYLRRNPNTAEWTGFCHSLAAYIGLGPQPFKGDVKYTLPNGEVVVVPYVNRLGIAIAYHSGDLMNRPFISPTPIDDVEKNLQYFIDRFLKDPNHPSFVINASLAGQAGFWYRNVVAVSQDGKRVLATNNNMSGKELVVFESTRWTQSKGGIREAYEPVSQSSPAAAGLNRALIAEIPVTWRYDNRMDAVLVGNVLAGRPLR